MLPGGMRCAKTERKTLVSCQSFFFGHGRGRISLLREWAVAGYKTGICSKCGKKTKDMNKTP
jgi:hypothetical protein